MSLQNIPTHEKVFQLIAAIVAAAAVLAVWASPGHHTASTTDAGEPVWPARIAYFIDHLPIPALDAELVRVSHIFEGMGFHSYLNYELTPDGTPGACTVRDGRDYLVSTDGCDGPYLGEGDNYHLDPDDERGANPYMRPNGGIPVEVLDRVAESDELAQETAGRLGLASEDVVTFRASSLSECHNVGLECDHRAEQEVTKVIHRPSSLLLLETELFSDTVISHFEVTEIQSGAPLPSRLKDG